MSANGLVVGESWSDVSPYPSHAVLWNTRATQTVVSTSANASTFGQSVTFTAQVTSMGGITAGDVELLDGDVSIGTATLSEGSASFDVSTLSAGSHGIKARYVGVDFGSGESEPLSYLVTPAESQTTLIADPTASTFGQSVTLTAIVTSFTTPGGSVEFYDGVALLGTVTVAANGTASFSTSGLSIGQHSLTAVYLGNASFSSSVSAIAGLIVSAANVAPTPSGSNVVNNPIATLPDGSTASVSITFGTVTSPGQTTVTTSTAGPPPPDGFKIVGGMQPIITNSMDHGELQFRDLVFRLARGANQQREQCAVVPFRGQQMGRHHHDTRHRNQCRVRSDVKLLAVHDWRTARAGLLPAGRQPADHQRDEGGQRRPGQIPAER